MPINDSHYWDSIGMKRCELGDQALWRQHSDTVNIQLLERWLPDSSVNRLLKTDGFDEAVGAGLHPLLCARAKHVVNIDISGSMLLLARARYLELSAVQADVCCLPYPDNTFDVVVSNSTLDHFTSSDQIVQSLRELNRTLVSGGQLLITMDNLANPAVWLRNTLPFRWLNAMGLVPYYVGVTGGPQRLRGFLRQAGFEVLETTAILHCPRILAIALARYAKGRMSKQTQRLFLRFLLAFERLERWPTRYLTGYFVAIRSAKR